MMQNLKKTLYDKKIQKINGIIRENGPLIILMTKYKFGNI